MNSRLTMDYGLRFTHQQPQHDKFGQMSNFFPDEWSAAQAPVFYVAGCSNGAATCSGNIRNAMDPRNGQILTAAGAANTQAAIGTPIPGSGNPLNGIRKAGDGIADTGYVWPTIVVAPRFGLAYDLTGNQSTIFRAGGGLFFDRPDGNTIFGIPGNPPIATTQDLRNGQLQTLGQGLSTVAVPALTIFQYDAQVSGVLAVECRAFRGRCPGRWSPTSRTSATAAPTGSASYNLNAVDIGAAFLAQNQDPTLAGSSTVPGATALHGEHPEAVPRPGQHQSEHHGLLGRVPLDSDVPEPPLPERVLGSALNYTLRDLVQGQHRSGQAPASTRRTARSRCAPTRQQYEELLGTLDRRPHIIKANGVWRSAARAESFGRAVGFDPERLAARRRAHRRVRCGLRSGLHTYQNNGGNVNLTGSPELRRPGSSTSAIRAAAAPTTSTRSSTWPRSPDRSPAALVWSPGGTSCAAVPTSESICRSRETFAWAAAAAWSSGWTSSTRSTRSIIDAARHTVKFASPTNLTIVNNQFNADGTLNTARAKPNNSGFGAATGAQAMRNVQAAAPLPVLGAFSRRGARSARVAGWVPERHGKRSRPGSNERARWVFPTRSSFAPALEDSLSEHRNAAASSGPRHARAGGRRFFCLLSL